ncbi:hypothetical protein MKK67_12760 [Methylobacterium sp. J-072]|uniref:hypothetical protein n=1 Tax=Methylobacterium sp. J-072 TaxID=2836651 RepID=UPI001FBB7643|nr:hypothetical protein [Methylobacterium sp. J-072]MCJ2093349.1 hypothetical protein [Methylobacterium sp. J-072]
MTTLPSETGPAGRDRSLGQRLFARYGSTAILSVVLLVVVGWIGILGWVVTRLFG